MKLSVLKTLLYELDEFKLQLPNGQSVPDHFHVTEIGELTKHFIDCGGIIRKEKKINLQLWYSTDYDHRLHPEKLLNIIELSEKKLGLGDHEIEVEYQGETIQKYGLHYNNGIFHLTARTTSCLAPDKCGIPEQNAPGLKFENLQLADTKYCVPGSGCC